ncbi:TLC domain-containing protein [Aphelenchoides fujianensis]|nr:TLC domain-containing protein [Aphelenchoides fujianensis]
MSGLPSDWRVEDAPPFGRLLEAEIFGPLLLVVVFFQLVSVLIRRFTWTTFDGFKQYRLRNLTVCFLHSCFVGGWVGVFFVFHWSIMLGDPVFYFRPWMKGVLFVTVGYFLHDTIDMLQFELSRWTLELFAHHLATGFVMSCAICSEKFVGYAYWSLLMERLPPPADALPAERRPRSPPGRLRVDQGDQSRDVRRVPLLRAGVGAALRGRLARSLPRLLLRGGFFGGLFFLLTNILLFFRLLAADGLLGEFGRKHAAINRDEQKAKKQA